MCFNTASNPKVEGGGLMLDALYSFTHSIWSYLWQYIVTLTKLARLCNFFLLSAFGFSRPSIQLVHINWEEKEGNRRGLIGPNPALYDDLRFSATQWGVHHDLTLLEFFFLLHFSFVQLRLCLRYEWCGKRTMFCAHWRVEKYHSV